MWRQMEHHRVWEEEGKHLWLRTPRESPALGLQKALFVFLASSDETVS